METYLIHSSTIDRIGDGFDDIYQFFLLRTTLPAVRLGCILEQVADLM